MLFGIKQNAWQKICEILGRDMPMDRFDASQQDCLNLKLSNCRTKFQPILLLGPHGSPLCSVF